MEIIWINNEQELREAEYLLFLKGYCWTSRCFYGRDFYKVDPSRFPITIDLINEEKTLVYDTSVTYNTRYKCIKDLFKEKK